MPTYDFRCNQCKRPFSLFFKSFNDYDPAGQHTCPHCGSASVERRIRRVAIARPSRDLSSLQSDEMLNVLDGGDSREIGTMFRQVIETTGEDPGPEFREATERLMRGESLESVERDLEASDTAASPSMAAADDDF